LKKSNNPYSSFGLAFIYSHNNNPFYNLDSASKYINISYNSYRVKRLKQIFSGFTIDSISILRSCDSIAWSAFQIIRKSNSAEALDKFLLGNCLAYADLIKQAIYLRDEIEFDKTLRINKSDSTKQFIITHPQSGFLSEALLFIDRQLFDEQTKFQTEKEYLSFIKKYPDNVMLNSAYEQLYNRYQKESNISGLKYFVNNFYKAPQVTEAWKLLFSLSVKSFSSSELEKFLKEHPAFPFKNSILKELELNKFTLYPYQKEDSFGFVDSTGKIVISAGYDAVTDFSEGLSVVSKNDSVFYINKENSNVFNRYFSDAYSFKNGIAAIKKNNKWEFINRQGQSIGSDYDEVSELSNNAYVIKLNNKYGALDYFGQTIIEPRLDKLGDFKSEFAYYVEEGKYGFVSKTGYFYKAEFEWISDFNEKNIAILKQNNSYGLVNSQGVKILSPQYDMILKGENNIFILVKNSNYGFYNGNGCYLSQVIYDFIKEKPAEFYTNGNVLKLIKKNETAFADLNGRVSPDFGLYDDIGFAANGLIRVKRKNKFGFADKKLSVLIPLKYQQASDFSDSLAIVKLKDKNILINISGKEIYSDEETIEKLSRHYYLAGEDEKNLINNRGEKIFINLKNIQKVNNRLLIVTLNNNEVRFIRD